MEGLICHWNGQSNRSRPTVKLNGQSRSRSTVKWLHILTLKLAYFPLPQFLLTISIVWNLPGKRSPKDSISTPCPAHTQPLPGFHFIEATPSSFPRSFPSIGICSDLPGHTVSISTCRVGFLFLEEILDCRGLLHFLAAKASCRTVNQCLGLVFIFLVTGNLNLDIFCLLVLLRVGVCVVLYVLFCF